ncbi:MAG: Eco57I restriction-modification methylase domain-containing protein, partial [Candidatus Binatia bacterium]
MHEPKQYDQKKLTGSHFTPPGLARFVARLMFNHFNGDGQLEIRVLDPSCGNGELLATFAQVAPSSIRERLTLIGVDSNAAAISEAEARLSRLPVKRTEIIHADFLDMNLRSFGQADFFNEAPKREPVHAIIANPPYVRTQVLGARRAQQLASSFNLKGRVDLYQAFLVAMTQELCLGGILGVITSNRFLSTKSGASTRGFLAANFDIAEVCDLGDTKLFDAAVLPAVFVGLKNPYNGHHHQKDLRRFVRIYESETKSPDPQREDNIFSILDRRESGLYQSGRRFFKVSSGVLAIPSD